MDWLEQSVAKLTAEVIEVESVVQGLSEEDQGLEEHNQTLEAENHELRMALQDDDQDGVVNGLDLCPDTDTRNRIDRNGCRPGENRRNR